MLFDFEFTKISLRRLLVILVAVAMIFSQFAVIGYADDGYDQEYTNEGSVSGDAEEVTENVEAEQKSVSGNADDVLEIRFETGTPISVYEGVDGFWIGDKYSLEFNSNYLYEMGKNIITVVKRNGTEERYTSDCSDFYDSNGVNAFSGRDMNFTYDYDESLTGWYYGSYRIFTGWKAGEEHYYTIELYKYPGYTCQVPVEVKANPVKEIRFECVETPIVYGYWYDQTDASGNATGSDRVFNANWYRDDILNRVGNKLIVITDEGTEEYTYKNDPEPGFYDSNSNKLCNKVGSGDNTTWVYPDASDSEIYKWNVGGYDHLNVWYMGHMCQVPVIIEETTNPWGSDISGNAGDTSGNAGDISGNAGDTSGNAGDISGNAGDASGDASGDDYGLIVEDDSLSIDNYGNLNWRMATPVEWCRVDFNDYDSSCSRIFTGSDAWHINIDNIINELIDNGQINYADDYYIHIYAEDEYGICIYGSDIKYPYGHKYVINSIEFIPSAIDVIENTQGEHRTQEIWDVNNECYYIDYYHYDLHKLLFKKGNSILVNQTDEYYYSEYNDGFYNNNGECLDFSYTEEWVQYDNPWEVGGSYRVYISVPGCSSCVYVNIIENPVQQIAFEFAETPEIYEESDGCWCVRYLYDDDGNQIGEENYFQYNEPYLFNEGNKLYITTADGTEVLTYHDSWPGGYNENGFYDSSDNLVISGSDVWDISSHSNQHDEHWTLGSNNYFTVEYMNRTCQVQVNIVPNPVESISFTPAKDLILTENTGGSYCDYDEYDEATDTWNTLQFFHYDAYRNLIYSDGNKVTVNGTEEFIYKEDGPGSGFFDADGKRIEDKYGELQFEDDQWNNHWTLGINHFTLSLLGKGCDCTVTISENPVKNIKFIPAEALYCYKADNSLSPSGESNYYFDMDEQVYTEGSKLIVNGTDEYVYQKLTGYRYDEGFVNSDGDVIELYSDIWFSTYESDNQLYLNVEYMGRADKISINIIDNPILSIEYDPVNEKIMYEGSDHFFYISYEDGDKLLVTTRDGQTTEYTFSYHIANDSQGHNTIVMDFCNGNDYIAVSKIQDVGRNNVSEWSAPGIYQAYYSYKGVVFSVDVNYKVNNVSSIEFELADPEEYYENTYGWWDYDYPDGTKYYHYNGPHINNNGNRLRVTYTDNSVKEYVYIDNNFRDENGETLDEWIGYSDNQESEHWTVGSDNYGQITYRGCSCNVPVTIIKNDVESINYIPDNWVAYRVPGDDHDDYYTSWYKIGDILEVAYEDGRVSRYTYQYHPIGIFDCNFVDENGKALNPYLLAGQSAIGPDENGWMISAFGKETSGTFIIKDANVKSVSVDVKHPINAKDYEYDGFVANDGTEYIICYWAGRKGDRGDRQVYAIFEQGDTITITDTDDNATIYTFQKTQTLYGFFDAEGNELPREFLNIYDNGYYCWWFNPENQDQYWSSNKDNEIYVSYLGHKAEEPIKVYLEDVRAFISQTDITVEDAVYSGSELTPNVSVTFEGESLTEGEDYTLTYENNVNAGTATVTVAGIGYYKGEETVEFNIAPLVATPELELSATEFTYNGEAQKPDVIVKVNGKVIDAEVTFSGSCIDAGKYTASVNLDGNIIGSASQEFEIKRAEVTPDIELSQYEYTYNGEVQIPEVTVKVNGKEVPANIYMSPDSTDAGTYSVRATLIGNYRGNAIVSYVIKPVPVTPVMELSADGFIYNGKVQQPEITVSVNGKEAPADITFSGECKDAGTYTVTATLTGNYAGSAESSFTIDKLSINNGTVEGVPETSGYDGEDQTFEITVKAGGLTLDPEKDYTVTYKDNKMPGTATVTIEGIGNFAGTIIKTFEITHEHVWDEGRVDIEPTCTETGVKLFHCMLCTEVKTERISALGHDYHEVEGTAVAPTCTTAGKKVDEKCSRCGIVSEGDVLHALGHTEEVIAAVAPTCTETGLTEGKKCSVCGETLTAQQVVPALGHDYHEVEGTAVAPTCTTAGKEADQKCSRCDDVITGAEIPALGHTEEVLAAVAPTCTETGLTEGKKCSVCGEILTAQQVVPALGHDYHEVEGTAVAPTCTTAGKEADQKCSRCGIVSEGDVLHALGHTEEVIAAVAPTCTETGLTEGKKCSVCGEILAAQQVVPALGHDYHEVEGTAVAPTCTTAGKKVDEKCSRCGIVSEGDVLHALGHTEEVIAAVAPTCTETGLTEGKKCSVCGEVLKAQETVPALGHKEEVIPATAATCEEPGNTEGKKCSVCGEILVAPEKIAPIGHEWSDWAVVKEATIGSEGMKIAVCMHDSSHTKIESIEKVDPTALNDAIRSAEELAASVGVSEDGKDLEKGTEYVTENDKAALVAAVNKAKEISENKDSTAKDVEDAITKLNEAAETFRKAVKTATGLDKKGWQKEDGEWYYYENDGTLRTNGWAKDSAGWCWLGADGKTTKSKWIKDGSEWYYLKANGYMAANEWAKDSTGWCWMDGSGKITKSKWIKDGNEWYYLKANGYMAANEWAKDSTGWCWMDGSGKITKSKWIKDGGEWYYLKANGYMAANEWVKDSNGWMYMDGSGKITKSKWIQYKGDWYYLKSNGYMATGTQTIDGKTYKFDSSGKWIS